MWHWQAVNFDLDEQNEERCQRTECFCLHTFLELTCYLFKQHCVTSNPTHGFEKLKRCTLKCHVKAGHFEKTSSGFPSDVLRLLCLTAAFYFSGALTSNNPLLQLQSAGSLHAVFRNLRVSQIWGGEVVGHQRENQRTFSPLNMTRFY